MSRKKKTPATSNTNAQVIQIGSRVRCTDDGVEGRIVWANSTRVKIQWEEGEQVTWCRDALADKPIEILGPSAARNDSPQTETPSKCWQDRNDEEEVSKRRESGAERDPIKRFPHLLFGAGEECLGKRSCSP